MTKKNIITFIALTITAFPITMTYSYDLLLVFPVLFIVTSNILNKYYTLSILPTLAYMLYSDTSYIAAGILIFILGLTLVLRPLLIRDKFYLSSYFTISNIIANIGYILISDIYFITYQFLTIIIGSSIIFLLILYTIEIYHNKNTTKIIVSRSPLLLGILFLTVTVSTHLLDLSFENINLPAISVILSILYLNYTKGLTYSLLISTSYLILYKLFNLDNFNLNADIAIVYIITAVVFINPTIFATIFYIFLIALDYFVLDISDKSVLNSAFVAVAIFELLLLLLRDRSLSLNDNNTSVYKDIFNNFNDQVLNFATFLDDFSRNYITSNENKKNMNDSFNLIVENYCYKCNLNKECFTNKRIESYNFIKNSLLYGKDLRVKVDSKDMKEYLNICIHSDKIINKASELNRRYKLEKEDGIFESTLKSQINGISNTLRQLTVDVNNNSEINYNTFISFKNELTKRGYTVVSNEVKRLYKEEFLVEIGIKNISQSDVNTVIKSLAVKYISIDAEITITTISKDTLYFTITPKEKYVIKHASITKAKDNLKVSGDNVLTKELNNGYFISAISDGMGSGFRAYTESKQTLELIDSITGFTINTSTSINMLNTFYSFKEKMDQYATLDLIEINKSNGHANIFKMGSADSYLVRNNRLHVINNKNLPFGINEMVQKDNIKLEGNDIIVLTSDGVSDYINENDLHNTLTQSSSKEPHEILDNIYNNVLYYNSNTIKDDLSIVVLKLEEKVA